MLPGPAPAGGSLQLDSVAGLGDLNRDGRADLGIDYETYPLGGSGPYDGTLNVVFGSRSARTLHLQNLGSAGYQLTAPTPPSTCGPSIPSGNGLGRAVAPLGDFSATGHAEFAVVATGLGPIRTRAPLLLAASGRGPGRARAALTGGRKQAEPIAYLVCPVGHGQPSSRIGRAHELAWAGSRVRAAGRVARGDPAAARAGRWCCGARPGSGRRRCWSTWSMSASDVTVAAGGRRGVRDGAGLREPASALRSDARAARSGSRLRSARRSRSCSA